MALACSPAPEGHDHWTLRLLAGKVVELGLAPALSHETVRLRLKNNLVLKPFGIEKGGSGPAFPGWSADFVTNMERAVVWTCMQRQRP